MRAALLAAAAAVALALVAAAPHYEANKINVHLVCHTHDDVGWLKTVDQYYMGANNSIQHAGVQFILDSVVPALVANPERSFIYVEQAFFQRWWSEQKPAMQATVKSLVASGQLEFVNGGWCMHDEATTHYVDMIDQTTLGHTFLNQEFGVQPRIGWQIDPFGHSSTQAALLSAEVGFDALFFGRIDYQDHDLRMNESRMEFVWRASPSLGASTQVFTGAFQSGNYGPPDGFCYDWFCSDPPIQEDPNLEDVNLQDRVNKFVDFVNDYYTHNAPTGHVMFEMGSDFMYENANEWYKNLDKLIAGLNADGRINVFYSTPSQYVDAVHATGVNWTVKTDDFFPYADDAHSYWTGYFTSRPLVKGYVRSTSSFLQAARQLEVYTNGPQPKTALTLLEKAMGVAQHHDAVSGTEKQHVAYDYAKRISIGAEAAIGLTSDFISAAVKSGHAGSPSLKFTQCPLANVSYCPITQESEAFTVVLYNPLSRARADTVTLPVSVANVVVTDGSGATVSSTVFTNTLPGITGSSDYSVSFVASLPPLGYATYFITPVRESTKAEIRTLPEGETAVVSNGVYSIAFGPTGRISQLDNIVTGLSIPFTQEWYWYNSSNNGIDQSSGAYIFRPNGTLPFEVNSGSVTVTVQESDALTVVTQEWAPWLTQEIRMWANQPFVEVLFSVGPVPIGDGEGKEIISRYSAPTLASEGYMYTDSNGREMLQRLFDYRPTWKLNVTEPVACNYFPVNALAFIKDAQTQLTVLPDRSEGGASLSSGQLELMVHRRILQDDGRGVGEPLNETQSITPYPQAVRIGPGITVRASHRILLDAPSSAAADYRPQADELYFRPVALFAPLTTTIPAYRAMYNTNQTFTAAATPKNVALITLRVWNETSFLIRVGHQFAVGEDPVLSLPATVDLAAFLPKQKITNVVEMSLTANQPLSNVHRLQWNTVDAVEQGKGAKVPVHGTQVTLGPMEIRTFLVAV